MSDQNVPVTPILTDFRQVSCKDFHVSPSLINSIEMEDNLFRSVEIMMMG